MAYTAYECLTLEQILERVRKSDPSGKGCDLIERACHFAEKAHAGQVRKSGEPYIVHPTYVASILTELMIDPPTIAASFLHDTVEDCEGVTLQSIQTEFGDEVAQLVDGVTKLSKLDFADREEQQAESLRKMILAMSKDIRVVLIKLADRLHNMRTLRFKPVDRQIAIARETLDIYAPLAHRLGVYTIKQELEDLALRYIDPEGYQDVARKVGMKRAEREENIKLVISELSQKLNEAGMHYEIDGRPKHLYSIYRKMVIEIQIRTWEMHRVAEYGIAAHWNYKEGAHGDGGLDQKLYWLRQILDWQSETRDSHEFIDSLKTDLFSEEVFLFTPKGDIISMQRGATPLDFAYRIHSQVGNTCVGAKINGKMVPLDTQLSTGDRVEIITSGASKGPSMDWLKIVKTQQAKAKIRQFLKKELRGENVQKGRDMLEHEAKRRGVKLGDYTKPEYYEPLLRKYMFQDLEDIYGAVGYGGVASAYVLSRLIDEKQKREAPVLPKVTVVQDGAAPAPTPQPPKGKPTHGIYVHGESGMLVRFAKCCNPVPGDDIVGYITRGRGVTVHKADCVNALHTEPERAIPVSWADEGAGTFSANLQMICYDHPSLLGEISAFISEMNLPLTAISVKLNKNKTCNITSTIQVQSREQLDNAIRKLQKRSDVIEAYRSVN